jgi:HTH-type transcriptional regulator/antitoxin HipB
MTMTAKEVGRLVRNRRKELGMKQGELALVAGTGTRFVGDLERGKETCVLGKTLKVLANLGIELVVQPKKGA